MLRLYFLAPDVETAHRIVDDLLLNRVEERHIHVIARDDVPMEDLPEAGVAQSSNLVKAAERGLAVGGTTGLLAGIFAVTFPPAGFALGGGAVLALAVAGAGFGAWVAGLIGIGGPNTEIQQFEDAVRSGKLLMMVDVPKDMERKHEIEELIRAHHPQARIGGAEPTHPAFP